MEKDYRMISSGDVERYIPFLRGHIAKKYGTDCAKEDLFSAGLAGIAEGIRRFDPRKNVPRDYWVQRYAAHYVMNEAKGNRAEAETRAVLAEHAQELSPPKPADPAVCAENEEILALALAALSREEREVIDAVYRECVSLRALARRIGVNVDVVFRIHRRALKKMKKSVGIETE